MLICEKVKEVNVEQSPELKQAIATIGFEDAPIGHQYNHFQYVFPIITWRKANAIHKFFVDEVQVGMTTASILCIKKRFRRAFTN